MTVEREARNSRSVAQLVSAKHGSCLKGFPTADHCGSNFTLAPATLPKPRSDRNRPVRTRMPGGVGAGGLRAPGYPIRYSAPPVLPLLRRWPIGDLLEVGLIFYVLAALA